MGSFIAMVLLLAFEWSGSVLTAGPMLFSMNAILAMVVVFAGLVGMARLALGGHTSIELWLGYLSGFVAVLLAYSIL